MTMTTIEYAGTFTYTDPARGNKPWVQGAYETGDGLDRLVAFLGRRAAEAGLPYNRDYLALRPHATPHVVEVRPGQRNAFKVAALASEVVRR